MPHPISLSVQTLLPALLKLAKSVFDFYFWLRASENKYSPWLASVITLFPVEGQVMADRTLWNAFWLYRRYVPAAAGVFDEQSVGCV